MRTLILAALLIVTSCKKNEDKAGEQQAAQAQSKQTRQALVDELRAKSNTGTSSSMQNR